MEKNCKNAVDSILSDLNSKTINQRFCDFVSDCLLTTLSNPIRLNDCKDLNVATLIELKREADSQIREDLKKEFNLEVDVGKITSVFEKPSFYNDILSEITKLDKSLSLNNSERYDSLSKGNLETCSYSTTGLPGIKTYEKQCSLKTGHVDLDTVAIEHSKFNDAKMMKSFYHNNCSCSQVDEGSNLIEPIVSPPLTESRFKLVNINFYLSLSKFCGCCQKRLKDVSILNSLNKEIDTLESSVAFNNEFSLFRPFTREQITNNQTISTIENDSSKSPGNETVSLNVSPPECNLDLPLCKENKETDPETIKPAREPILTLLNSQTQSLLNTPASTSDSETLSQAVPDFQSDTSGDGKSIELILPIRKNNRFYDTSKELSSEICCKGKEDLTEESSKEALNNGEHWRNDQKSVDCDILKNKSSDVKVDKDDTLIADNTENVSSAELSVSVKKSESESLENKPFNHSKTSDNMSVDTISKAIDEFFPKINVDRNEPSPVNKLKLLVSNDKKKVAKKLLKMLQKDKRKKKKLMRAKIDLAPPPGVDLDEFLKEQVECIKLRLKHISNTEVNPTSNQNNLEIPDLIKEQLKKENSKKLNSLGSTVSTVLHDNHDINTRKVFDIDIAKDFESLPEFDCTSEIASKNLNNEKRSNLKPQTWKKPLGSKGVKKSVVLRLRNRSRTPQISKNRLNSFKQASKFNTLDKSQETESQSSKIGDTSKTEGNLLKEVNESNSVPTIVISDDDLMDSALAPLNESKSKISSTPNKNAENSKKCRIVKKVSRDSDRCFRSSELTKMSPKRSRSTGTNESTDSENSGKRSISRSPKRVRCRRYQSKSKSPRLEKSVRTKYDKSPLSFKRKRTRSKSPHRGRRHPPYRRKSRSTSPRRKLSPRRRFRSRSKSPRYKSPIRWSRKSGTPRRVEPKRRRYRSRSPILPHSKTLSTDSPSLFDEEVFLNVLKAASPPRYNNPTHNVPVNNNFTSNNYMGIINDGSFPSW